MSFISCRCPLLSRNLIPSFSQGTKAVERPFERQDRQLSLVSTVLEGGVIGFLYRIQSQAQKVYETFVHQLVEEMFQKWAHSEGLSRDARACVAHHRAVLILGSLLGSLCDVYNVLRSLRERRVTDYN